MNTHTYEYTVACIYVYCHLTLFTSPYTAKQRAKGVITYQRKNKRFVSAHNRAFYYIRVIMYGYSVIYTRIYIVLISWYIISVNITLS